MKLKAYDKTRLNSNAYTANRKILTQFMESNMDCAVVEDYPQSQPYACANSLNASIKVYRMGNVRAIVRNKIVYLIKD